MLANVPAAQTSHWSLPSWLLNVPMGLQQWEAGEQHFSMRKVCPCWQDNLINTRISVSIWQQQQGAAAAATYQGLGAVAPVVLT